MTLVEEIKNMTRMDASIIFRPHFYALVAGWALGYMHGTEQEMTDLVEKTLAFGPAIGSMSSTYIKSHILGYQIRKRKLRNNFFLDSELESKERNSLIQGLADGGMTSIGYMSSKLMVMSLTMM